MNIVKKIREQRGLAIDVVSHASRIPQNRIIKIEATGIATDTELKSLAEVYGVPRFALRAKTAQVAPIPIDFRTRGNSVPKLGKSGLRSIYRVEKLLELNRVLDSKQRKKIVKHPVTVGGKAPSLSNSVRQEIVEQIKEITSYSADKRSRFEDAYKLQIVLRYGIEKTGVFFLCDRLLKESFRGFCLSRQNEAAIVLNVVKQHPSMRVFTTIHELVHILIERPGIVDPFNYRNEIEKICNRITSSYLMPKAEFLEVYMKFRGDDTRILVNRLSKDFHVSKYAAAIRIQELTDQKKFVSRWLSIVSGSSNLLQSDFDTQDPTDDNLMSIGQLDYESDELESDGEEKFLPRPTSASYQVNRLGFSAFSLVDKALQSNLLSKYDVASFLDISPAILDDALRSYRRKRAEVERNVISSTS